MLLKCCLNGPRTPDEHPALPVHPAQIGSAAAEAAAAGAGAVHAHVKDAAGHDTFDPDRTDAVVEAVRGAAPGVPLGLTTGAWAEPDPRRRVAAIKAWSVLPDFASVNFHEDGAADVAAALLTRGIRVEAGLWTLDAVTAWLGLAHRSEHLRVLVELPDGPDADRARVMAEEMMALLDGATDLPVLLHGCGSSAWPVLLHALELGLDTRIGLEDVLVLPDGTPAADNAGLVHAALVMAGG